MTTQLDESAPGDVETPEYNPWPNVVWCLTNKDCRQFGDTKSVCNEQYECECDPSGVFTYPVKGNFECHPQGTLPNSPVLTTFTARWQDANCDKVTRYIKDYMIDVLERHFATNVKVIFVCGSVSIIGSAVISLSEMATKLTTLEEEIITAVKVDVPTRGVLLGVPSISAGRASVTGCKIEDAMTTTFSDVTGRCYAISCEFGYEPSPLADKCIKEPSTNPVRPPGDKMTIQLSWIIGLSGLALFSLLGVCAFLGLRQSCKYETELCTTRPDLSVVDSVESSVTQSLEESNSVNDIIIQTAPSSSDGFSEIYVT